MQMLILAAAAFAAPLAPPLATVPDQVDEEVARSLPSPGELEQVGETLDRAMGALLQVRIGPLVEAVDPGHGRHIRRDETLGDMARRDDPYFDQRMRATIAAASENMGEMMARIARLAPALRRSLEDFEHGIEGATRGLPD